MIMLKPIVIEMLSTSYLTEEGIDIMPHPPYSPNLAPCDYWLNDYIKNRLTDQADEKSLASRGFQDSKKYLRRRV